MYSVRIACPKCSMQQTFRGTPPEIGDAVEMWNSRHQLTAHTQTTGADVKTDLTVKGRSSWSRRPATLALFGLTTTLNAAIRCALTGISAAQLRN